MPYKDATIRKTYHDVYNKQHYIDNREAYLAKGRQWNREKRQKVLSDLGGKCVRCGFSDWRALQIDHIHGGGAAEHRTLKRNICAWYKKVLANPDEYQLLCANCNWIKRYEMNEHK